MPNPPISPGDVFVCKWADGRPGLLLGQSWPNAGGPILGGTPLKWYVTQFPPPPILAGPQYQAVQGDEHLESSWIFEDYPTIEEGMPAGTAYREWSIVQRPKDAQLADLDLVERKVLDRFYPANDIPVRQESVNSAMRARLMGIPLSQEQAAAEARSESFNSVAASTAARRAEIAVAIEAGTAYDLFDGWELPRAEVEALFTGAPAIP